MFFLSLFVFFFKQKTAYEMRISDWSLDVCSSDLHLALPRALPLEQRHQAADRREQPREGIADADAHAGRRAIREAGHVAEPSHRLGAIGRASCRERVCQYV